MNLNCILFSCTGLSFGSRARAARWLSLFLLEPCGIHHSSNEGREAAPRGGGGAEAIAAAAGAT